MQGQGPSLQGPGHGQGLDLQGQGQVKDFTYSYLLQVAANLATIAIKQQQWTQSESSQHMTVKPITLNK